MQEKRAGNKAPVWTRAGGTSHAATSGVGAQGRGDDDLPEIIHIRREHGVAGGVRDMETHRVS